MEQWDREELYRDVWDQPVSRLTEKYGISGVAIAKACRKLKVPLPGRGYWARKQAGQSVRPLPLPKLKDVPIVWRIKTPTAQGSVPKKPEPEPSDEEWLRIREMEARSFVVPENGRLHPLVTATREALSTATPDYRGVVAPSWSANVLDVRVSKNSVTRALRFLNAVLQVLDAESFEIVISKERHRADAKVFGHLVAFGVSEKSTVTGRRTIQEYSWTRQETQYQPSGRLLFRVGPSQWRPDPILADGAKRRLENLVPQAVGAIMREARMIGIREEQRRQRELAEMQRARERAALAEQIQYEEKRIEQLRKSVDNWIMAARMREYAAALEAAWIQRGVDMQAESESGQRLKWIRQQADRMDPLVTEKPASILDRKHELPAGYRY